MLEEGGGRCDQHGSAGLVEGEPAGVSYALSVLAIVNRLLIEGLGAIRRYR